MSSRAAVGDVYDPDHYVEPPTEYEELIATIRDDVDDDSAE